MRLTVLWLSPLPEVPSGPIALPAFSALATLVDSKYSRPPGHRHFPARFLGDFTSTIVPENSLSNALLSNTNGSPGDTNTIVGRGFEPWTKIIKVTIGSADAILLQKTTTDGMGNFELDFIVPGEDVGVHQVHVHLDGDAFNAGGFTVTDFSWGGQPRINESLYRLGDNFVRAFHYSEYGNCWTFYDPEYPRQSDLHFFVTGECYWILVKEPAEVILNNTPHNLTCTPEGNCWNQIIW